MIKAMPENVMEIILEDYEGIETNRYSLNLSHAVTYMDMRPEDRDVILEVIELYNKVQTHLNEELQRVIGTSYQCNIPDGNLVLRFKGEEIKFKVFSETAIVLAGPEGLNFSTYRKSFRPIMLRKDVLSNIYYCERIGYVKSLLEAALFCKKTCTVETVVVTTYDESFQCIVNMLLTDEEFGFSTEDITRLSLSDLKYGGDLLQINKDQEDLSNEISTKFDTNLRKLHLGGYE